MLPSISKKFVFKVSSLKELLIQLSLIHIYYFKPLSGEIAPLEGTPMDVLAATEEDWYSLIMEGAYGFMAVSYTHLISVPLMRMLPLSARRAPARIDRSVVFPQPLVPTIPTHWPGPAEKLTPFRILCFP